FLHIFDYVYLHWFGSLNIHKSSLISADRENFFFGGDFLVSPGPSSYRIYNTFNVSSIDACTFPLISSKVIKTTNISSSLLSYSHKPIKIKTYG
ncbi:hypothetical protein NSB20_21780, partial [Bacteroides acidifaciens]|uniref:hypothetical protein n=1 Tax=Bacteroides acidifaciens TaxID=85831 RepID=UPI00214A41C6